MVTSRDVATTAGVSQATVSRVLQGNPKVSAQAKRAVEDAMQAIGYVPNAAAQVMKTRRTSAIGVVVADLTNPFYPEILECIGATLAESGMRMVLWNAHDHDDTIALDAVRQGIVDGVIFTTVTAKSVALRSAIAERAPVVLVNRSVPRLACDQVSSGNVAGGRMVARYLSDAGHQRIGLISGPELPSTSSERERGFRAGLSVEGHIPVVGNGGAFTHEAGHRAARELLARDKPPTAVFCANDLVALGAIDGARGLGVRVPDELWVVGYDDIAMAAWESFDLTTVRQPMSEMTRRAVTLLLERIDNPGLPPRRERFASELVVRGSTAHVPHRRDR